MSIERAYELADAYAEKSKGFVSVHTMRYNFPYTSTIEIDYVLLTQNIEERKSFTSLELLINRLESLLEE